MAIQAFYVYFQFPAKVKYITMSQLLNNSGFCQPKPDGFWKPVRFFPCFLRRQTMCYGFCTQKCAQVLMSTQSFPLQRQFRYEVGTHPTLPSYIPSTGVLTRIATTGTTIRLRSGSVTRGRRTSMPIWNLQGRSLAQHKPDRDYQKRSKSQKAIALLARINSQQPEFVKKGSTFFIAHCLLLPLYSLLLTTRNCLLRMHKLLNPPS